MPNSLWGHIKKLLYGAAVILVAGLAYWFFQAGGQRTILEWFKTWSETPMIEATSTTRSDVDKFIAGEKIRFSLKLVQTDKVFWLFDDNEIIPGSIEIEYGFPFEPTQPLGITTVHRVHAFFRSGETYRVASRAVHSQNLKYEASVSVGQSGVRLIARTSLGDRWVLQNASLTSFEMGSFKIKGEIPLGVEAAAPDDPSLITGSIKLRTLRDALSFAENLDLKTQLANRRDAWVTYEFVDRNTKEKLAILQPLGPIWKVH